MSFAQCSHTATSSGKIPFVWTLRNNVDAGVWDLGACFVLSSICSSVFVYPNFSLMKEKGFFFPFFPFLACDLDYLHGGIWAIYPLYMA